MADSDKRFAPSQCDAEEGPSATLTREPGDDWNGDPDERLQTGLAAENP